MNLEPAFETRTKSKIGQAYVKLENFNSEPSNYDLRSGSVIVIIGDREYQSLSFTLAELNHAIIVMIDKKGNIINKIPLDILNTQLVKFNLYDANTIFLKVKKYKLEIPIRL